MSIISVNLPATALQSLIAILERIAVAAERIAGPVREYRPPSQATLHDYSIASPEAVAQVRQAEEEFAIQNMLVPGSPAYLSRIHDFEELVRESYGDEAVEQLPWRIRTGPPVEPEG